MNFVLFLHRSKFASQEWSLRHPDPMIEDCRRCTVTVARPVASRQQGNVLHNRDLCRIISSFIPSTAMQGVPDNSVNDNDSFDYNDYYPPPHPILHTNNYGGFNFSATSSTFYVSLLICIYVPCTVCMCVCMYVYMYVCMYVTMYVCNFVVCMCVCMYFLSQHELLILWVYMY